MDFRPPPSILDRLGRQGGLLLGGGLILVIAVLDYLTGYAFRLGELYLIPTAIIAWVAGALAGIIAAHIASLFWFVSFESGNPHLHPGYVVWEAVAMFGGLCAFAWLAARLKLALTHADERFVMAMKKLPTAIYVSDERKNEFLYANERLLHLAGSSTAITPRDFEQHFTQENDAAYHLPATGHRPEFVTETWRDRRTGRWYLLQHNPIPWGPAGNAHLKVLTDITDRKQSEFLREKHGEALHQAARMTSLAEVASSLAHEINQPLMVIATYTDATQRLIESGGTDLTEIAAVLKKCQRQAERAAAIVQRLRDFIRQRKLHSEVCNSAEIVAEAVDLLQGRLDEAGIRLQLDGLEPGIDFVADRVLITQVLDNLLRNAIEAMRETPPAQRRLTVTVRCETRDRIVFSVIDRGPGLALAAADRLFTPFYSTKENGVGLGLAICRSIAEAHDGGIWADRNPLGGAIFNLDIPHIPTTSHVKPDADGLPD